MSLSYLVSGVPATTRRFSLTENWAVKKVSVCFGNPTKNYYASILTLWSLKVDNGVVILEHVDLINVLKLLHTELLDARLELLALFHGFVVDNLLGSSLGSCEKLKIRN